MSNATRRVVFGLIVGSETDGTIPTTTTGLRSPYCPPHRDDITVVVKFFGQAAQSVELCTGGQMGGRTDRLLVFFTPKRQRLE